MKVVLISGSAQHGKDTAASMMQEIMCADGNRVLITHYADLLKYICKNYLGWNGRKDEAGREMLQYVGTDIVRKQKPTLWVDFIAMILKFFPDKWDYVIIPDCRFPNEVSTMVDNGFDTVHIRIIRDGFKSPLTEEQQKHPSETLLENMTPNCVLHNGGTLRDLRWSVNQLIKETLYEKC